MRNAGRGLLGWRPAAVGEGIDGQPGPPRTSAAAAGPFTASQSATTGPQNTRIRSAVSRPAAWRCCLIVMDAVQNSRSSAERRSQFISSSQASARGIP